MKKAIIYPFLGMLIFLLQPLRAGAEDRNLYAVMKSGISLPSDYANATTSAGPAGELAVGYNFTPYFAVEGGFGYFRTDMTFPLINSKFRNEITPLTISFKGIHRGENFLSFVAIGVGTYSEDLKTTTGAVIINDKDSVFGYHLLFGYDFHLGNRIFGGFEFRVFSIRAAEFTVSNGSNRLSFDMTGSSLLGSVGWRY